MKKCLFILLIFCLINPISYAKIITGEIEYNNEIAKQEVFAESPAQINFEKIRLHLIDQNRVENLNAIYEGKKELNGRILAHYSDGNYGIHYLDDAQYSWFYSPQGRLTSFTHKETLTYPSKVVRYKPDGTISNLGLKISDNESYIYSTNGKLLAHWVGNLCYDENNNIIMTRSLEN